MAFDTQANLAEKWQKLLLQPERIEQSLLWWIYQLLLKVTSS